MPDFSFENLYPKGALVVGVDEVGCGPWAGPLVVAACALPQSTICFKLLDQIQDSKKLTAFKRDKIFDALMQTKDILYSISVMEIDEFNQIGLKHALPLAIERATNTLKPDYVLMDGIRDPKLKYPTTMIVKGDQKSFSIAAASIIAKVTRDRIMTKLHEVYPAYGWDKNAGYGTKQHQEALQEFGITPHHRTGYKPIQAYL